MMLHRLDENLMTTQTNAGENWRRFGKKRKKATENCTPLNADNESERLITSGRGICGVVSTIGCCLGLVWRIGIIPNSK